MHAWKRSVRTSGAITILLQLVLAVGVPVADASHGAGLEDHAHIQSRDDGPCSTAHAPGCQLARVLATGGLPIPSGLSVLAPHARHPFHRPAQLDIVRDLRLLSSQGPRAPPTL
ncbi:MAG: hypothetical protein ACOC8B_01365 [Gemmatimonadota bacterium]